MKKYDVAAYVWPAYTGDEPRSRIFWPEGIGEWQTVKNMHEIMLYKPKGYTWNRKPLWGYVNEADPYVIEMEIEAAVDHGVNVFIYDWYWYDNRPYLENCLNDGFLKAKNHDKMKFYLMWANHDVGLGWDRRISSDLENTVWEGKVNFEQFQVIARRWIERYFTLPCYYRIDGKPVLSVYEVANLIDGFGSVEQAREALDWLRQEVKNAGFPDIHLQMIKIGGKNHRMNLSGVDRLEVGITYMEALERLGFDSCTHYQYVHFTSMNRDYTQAMQDVKKEWEEIRETAKVEYYPHVSIGWDNNPRYRDFADHVARNNGPEVIEQALRDAKAYSDAYNHVPLITVNSWNEWTETSYLEPDSLHGYGYLEAVKKVFKTEE